MINLEAAGTTGGALLFQATSKEMIEAFSHSPYPRGTVIAADVFSSGIILSDTDFGQFEEYLGVSGLDMAIVGHSYYYHTRKDITANIERGSGQHFSSNVMAIVDYLLSPASPLHSDKPFSPPDVVYMSLYDRLFFSWTMKSADFAYVAIATAVVTLAAACVRRDRLQAFGLSLLAAPLSLLHGFITTNVAAAAMQASGNRSAWFSHEGLAVALYFPAGLWGYCFTQFGLDTFVPPEEADYLQTAHYYAQLLALTAYMLILQALRVRSAYLFAGLSCILLLGATATEAYKYFGGRSVRTSFAIAYIVPLSLLVILGMEAFTTTLDIFIPLAGRMGKEAPTEFLVATIASGCGLLFFPLASPLYARLTRFGQFKVLMLLMLTVVSIGTYFSLPTWKAYDAQHPKRMGVQYTYNHTSDEHTAHFAFMDMRGNTEVIETFHKRYGGQTKLEHTQVDDYNSDWDTLYPVSSFLDTYKFPLPYVGFDWPKLHHTSERERTPDGNLHIRIKMDHEGLVWPALAFEADLVDWSYDFAPPHGRQRHHIKAATSVDEHTIELELVVRIPDEEKIQLHWSAIGECSSLAQRNMLPATDG